MLLFAGVGCTTPVVRWFSMELRALGDVSVMPVPGYFRPADQPTDFRPQALAASALSHIDIGEKSLPLLLIGHSAGCQVAAEAAVRVADDATKLVLIGPTTDPRARSWPALAVRWLRTAIREPISLAPALARSYRAVGLHNMARAMAAARRHDLEATLDRTSCPVLVLRGRKDHIVPPTWRDRLSARRRVAAQDTQGAHMIVMTSPRQIVAHITNWLGDMPSDGSSENRGIAISAPPGQRLIGSFSAARFSFDAKLRTANRAKDR